MIKAICHFPCFCRRHLPFMATVLAMVLLWAPRILAQQAKGSGKPSVEQLATDYEKAHGEKKKAIGAQIVKQLIDEDIFFTPPPPVKPDMPSDTVDALVYYSLHNYSHVRASDSLQPQRCIHYAEKCMPLLRDKHPPLYANVMTNLARLHQIYLGDRQLAIEWAMKAIDYCKKTGNNRELSRAYTIMSYVFTSMRQGQQAVDYVLEAIDASRKSGDTLLIHNLFEAACEGYVELGQYDKAIEYGHRAVNAAKNRGSSPNTIGGHLTNLGYAYYMVDSLAKANMVLDEAFRQYEKDKSPETVLVTHQIKGFVLMKAHQNNEAARHFKEAYELASQMGILRDMCNLQRNIYEALRDTNPQEAMKALEKHTQLRDTLFNEELKSRLSEAEASFHNDQLKRDNEAAQSRMRYILVTAIIVMMLLTAVIGTLIYAMRTRVKAMKAIKSVQRAREQFFTNVTHEFRTPLTVILGVADRLRKAAEKGTPQVGGDDEKQVKDLESIERNGRQLLTLINQLLDVAKATSEIAPPEYQRGNLVAYVGMIVEGFRDMAQSKDITLTFTGPSDGGNVEVEYVADYVQKIVSNLLSNALKFTGEKGRVSVEMSRHGHNVSLKVSDTGQGIAEEDLPHIFETFYRGSHQQMGTGVGLSLVKQLVEALNGTIAVDSKPGVGTTFTVEMPVKETEKRLVAEVSGESGKPLILVVEDNADVAQFIGSVLADNYEVSYATDGGEGIRMAGEIMPDLIVTDIMMPDVDGLELCRRIRSSEVTNHIPLVIVTARVADEARMEGIKVGADAYLYKPFLADELLLRIEKLLETRRMLQKKFSASHAPQDDSPSEMAAAERLSPEITSSDVPSPQMTLFEQNLTLANEQFLSKLDDIIARLMPTGSCNVGTVAEELCMSRAQFIRKLKAVADITPSEYITTMKLNEVKRLLLVQPPLTFLDIAMRSGFSDNAHMTHAFKNKFGISPTQYLQNIVNPKKS